MAPRRQGHVFVESGPFVLDLAWPKDPRTPLTRKFLDAVRASGRGITSPFNVIEVVGAVSFNLDAKEVERLVRRFEDIYAVRLWPRAEAVPFPFSELGKYAARRMKLGDALSLWAAESSPSNVRAFVTWNVKDFEGRTRLPVLTPQQYLRGR